MPYPFIGGHEGAGVVEQIGSKVDHLAPGDHVLLTFSSCGTCVHCFQRIPAYCTQMRDLNFKGSRVDGTTGFTLVDDGRPAASHFFGQSSFAAKSIVSASSAVRIDKKLPLDIVCTFGCGIQTGAGTVLNVLKPRLGSTIAVFGAGAVGMAAIMAAKLTPAAKIIAVDVVESKLDSALQLGATDAINSLKVSVVDEIKKQTGGRGVDLALDATGRVEVIRDMFESAAPGSLVVTVGAPPMGQHIHIEPARWLEKGVSYMGAHQGSSVPQQVCGVFLCCCWYCLVEVWRSVNSYIFSSFLSFYNFGRVADFPLRD